MNKEKKHQVDYNTQIPADSEIKELNEVVDFLDGKRNPIKDSESSKMQGQFP